MSDQDTSDDWTQAETNLHQAADIEQASGWAVARLIASSVDNSSQGKRTDIDPWGSKLGLPAIWCGGQRHD